MLLGEVMQRSGAVSPLQPNPPSRFDDEADTQAAAR
jgi:hypothetical protein